MQDTRVSKPCQQCGRMMLVKQCLLQRKKYCSRRCLGLARVPELLAMTATRPTKPNSGNFKVGDNRGEANSKWVPSMALTCEYCAGPFAMKPWVYRVRNKFNGRVRFCSRRCFTDYRKYIEVGSKSPYWRGGYDGYYGRDWDRLRAQVISDQAGRCGRCDIVSATLHVHHKLPARCCATWTEANHRHNLIALCPTCHPIAERDSIRLSRAMCKHPKHHEAVPPRTHCPHGHELTPENTSVSEEGWRRCRVCVNARARVYQNKRRREKAALTSSILRLDRAE